jgi:hypothetical protein
VIVWALPCFAGTWDVVEDHRSDTRFVPPGPAERLAWSALAADLARVAPSGHEPADLDARASALGFEVVRAPGTVALVDRKDTLRGAGLVAVRLGPLDAEVVLQAPHPFFDLGTGRIASASFDEGGIRAVVVATANRAVAPDADPAHAPAGWFQAATDGLARGLSDPLFVQIHGFGEHTTDACAVVSEGSSRLSPEELQRASRVIASGLGCHAVVTGDAVPDLAARTNVQSQLLSDRAAFLHVELAREPRDELVADAAARALLTGALVRLAKGAP